jgi:ABC-type antimicrobial peptide transport system permease subunit
VRQDLTEGPVAQFYRPLDQVPDSVTDQSVSFFGYELAIRTSGDASRFIEPVRRVIQATAATVPYARIRPMGDMLGVRTRAWELGAKVFTAFGILALVLAAVGLYSVLAFSIAQRVHEFGVRMALGAQAGDIIRLTLSVGLAPVIGGIGAGVVLALLGGKYVSSLLFDVAPRDPMVLGTVCAVLLVTGVLASLVPAMRATRVDPAAVLRSE